jgi:hypothetical protein
MPNRHLSLTGIAIPMPKRHRWKAGIAPINGAISTTGGGLHLYGAISKNNHVRLFHCLPTDSKSYRSPNCLIYNDKKALMMVVSHTTDGALAPIHGTLA